MVFVIVFVFSIFSDWLSFEFLEFEVPDELLFSEEELFDAELSELSEFSELCEFEACEYPSLF